MSGRSPARYRLSHPISAVKLEPHPGSSLRSPTGDLVDIPAGAEVELEGSPSPSGLINVLWNGQAYSVFFDDLKAKAE